ncbi:MAG: hydrogenase maturation peptidase HycI [Elusimicrobiota bacterium]
MNEEVALLVVGIGNEMMCDDSAGPLLIKEIEKLILENGKKNITLIDVGMTPENFTAKIREAKANRIILVDAADFGAACGTVSIISQDKIDGTNFSTHGMPLGTIIDFIKKTVGTEVILLGIQKKISAPGESISNEVDKSVKKLALFLYNNGMMDNFPEVL